MQIVLDVWKMKEKKEAHDYLQEQMELPAYYGRNLDSLYDCLTEMGQTEIVLIHGECIEGYAKRVVKVMQHAAAENQEISICFREIASD